jgi:2-methylcitrate dehydratase PrpD
MARVTIRTARGEYRTTVEYPRGNAENPLDDAALEAKFALLTEDAIGAARSRELRAAIRELPEASDVRAFARLLRYEG